MRKFYVTVSKIGVATIEAETPEEATKKAETMEPEDYIWESGFIVNDVH